MKCNCMNRKINFVFNRLKERFRVKEMKKKEKKELEKKKVEQKELEKKIIQEDEAVEASKTRYGKRR